MGNRILELMNLNEDQVVALDLMSDIIVEACAGSGKTRALVARYLKILEEGRANVDGIVAITFTENAASEMKERIRDKIKHYIKIYGEYNHINKKSMRILHRAPIGTIHGFAARILKENPFESMLPTNFNILEGVERSLFIEEKLNEFIMRSWGSNNRSDKDYFLSVLAEEGYDHKRVREKIFSIVNLANTLHLEPPWGLFLGKSKSDNDLGQLIKGLLQDIGLGLGNSRNQFVQKRLENIRAISTTMKKLENNSIRARLLTELRSNLDTSSNGILGLKTASDEEKELANLLLEKINEILNLYDLDLTRSYLALAEESYQYLTQKKFETGNVEYEDLLKFARDTLLKNSVLLKHYRKKFKFIMVDEFQDTDNLQFEIINLLSRNGGANTFIVGDPKQSIFRFRGADLGVFYDIKKSKNTEKFIKNYRSDRRLIEFYNKFFDILLKDNYEIMEASKGEGQSNSSLEFILSFDENASMWREKEASLVSDRVLKLHEESCDFKDIAIICRSATNMHLIENALRKDRIPYYSSSGSGFFGQQEIRDVTSFIKYLLNPRDKICEACVLRSLFYGASDDELLAHYTGKEDIKGISDYLQFISCFRREIISLNPLSLLEFILEKTSYDSALLGLPDGGLKYSNLNKLISIFAKLESLGYGLDEILEYIDSNLFEDSEPLAQSEMEEEDSVKILTVHKAKGLEFPVVILTDINHGSGGGRENVIARRGEGFLVRHEGSKSQLWQNMNELEQRDIMEEEKRLLYVAKTRAKELLIISFSGQKKKDGEIKINNFSFAGLYKSVFGIPTDVQQKDKTSVLGFEIPIWRVEGKPSTKAKSDHASSLIPIEIDSIGERLKRAEEPTFVKNKVIESPIVEKLGERSSELKKGNLMHRFLQIWDFKKKSIRKTVRFALNEGYVVDDSLEEILIKLGEDFLSSDLLERIINADSYDREIPFYMVIDGMPERRKIDLMIKEGDRISLFDYKYTTKGKIGEKELTEYKSQLDVYGKAVEKHFGRYPIERTLVFLPDIELISVQ